MLLLFAGSQSSPAPRDTAAHSCLANKEQLSSREAGLTFQRSPPAANAATASPRPQPPPAQAEPTPHWAAPLTCQELGLPQGVNGARKHTLSLESETWLCSPHSAASWLCDLGKLLHLSEPHFFGLQSGNNNASPKVALRM